MNATADTLDIHADMTMEEILRHAPGAQRALFRKYHIGGCSSCGFQPNETLAGVSARNGGLDTGEIISYLRDSHAEDLKTLVEPAELSRLLREEPAAVKLLDIRTRDEWEAVQIEGSVLFSQEMMNEILMHWPRETGAFVVIDHQGARSMDAAAYFAGHGFANVRALRGGIDAWSAEINPDLPRYHLES